MNHRPAPANGQRAAQKLRTRQALADAARELFVTNGYGHTSADAIAGRAGVSRATFYLHFSSKADIVVALMRSLAGDLRQDITRLAACTTTEETRTWLESHTAIWRAHEGEFVAIREALGTEQQVADEWFAFVRAASGDVDAALGSPGQGERRRVAVGVFLLGLERTLASVLQQGYREAWNLVADALATQWTVLTGYAECPCRPPGERRPREPWLGEHRQG